MVHCVPIKSGPKNKYSNSIFVRTLVDKLFNFSVHNLFLDAKRYYHFSFFVLKQLFIIAYTTVTSQRRQ